MAITFAYPTWTSYFLAWAEEAIDEELAYDEGRRKVRGATYVIQCAETNRVKIGTAKHPRERLRQLQTGSSTTLELISTLDVDELWAHDDLREYRLRGEWFEWVPEVEAYVRDHTREAA